MDNIGGYLVAYEELFKTPSGLLVHVAVHDKFDWKEFCTFRAFIDESDLCTGGYFEKHGVVAGYP